MPNFWVKNRKKWELVTKVGGGPLPSVGSGKLHNHRCAVIRLLRVLNRRLIRTDILAPVRRGPGLSGSLGKGASLGWEPLVSLSFRLLCLYSRTSHVSRSSDSLRSSWLLLDLISWEKTLDCYCPKLFLSFLSSISSELCRLYNTTHCGWAFFMWVFHQSTVLYDLLQPFKGQQTLLLETYLLTFS